MGALEQLSPYLKPGAAVELDRGIPTAPVANCTPGLDANAYYFGRTPWAQGWFKHVHRYPQFRERWLAAIGSWDRRVVVDIGCGPGNVFDEIGGSPSLLIGVDVARGSLELSQRVGYTPLLADAQALPLVNAFADIVALNATVHHCDDMAATLAEAARLVRPGGVLVADHDPQLTAYDFRGLGKFLWNARMPLYRLMRRGGHRAADDEQLWAERTEIHHRPGDGVTPELFHGVLGPNGFDVQLYPHNHRVGGEALRGARGTSMTKMRIVQRLSGIDPSSDAGALSIMCIARRRE